ncbi:hypothetical protein NKY39_22895 [Sinorhizobium meliloti]|uniref:hypothetical protein n=1 Tax=Rhizobium meliloti TaxID=382 RepID=UPI003D647D30
MNFRLLAEVDRLDCLLRDIKRLQASDMTASDLGNEIPLLEDYRLTARRVPCLQGAVYGHPLLSDGKTIFTSELYAYFEDDGQLYARTLNHWYRLDVSRDRRQDA